MFVENPLRTCRNSIENGPGIVNSPRRGSGEFLGQQNRGASVEENRLIRSRRAPQCAREICVQQAMKQMLAGFASQ